MFTNVLPFPVMTTQLDTYPNRIRELRLERGLTQAALGEQIGTSAVHIGHLELGRRELSLSMMRAIARVLDVPTAEILSRDDNPLSANPRSRRLLGFFQTAAEPARQAIERVAESMVDYRPADPAPIATPWSRPVQEPAEPSAESNRTKAAPKKGR